MGKGKGPKRQGWQMPWTCWQRARQDLVALRLVRRCVPEPTALPAAAAAQATHGCIQATHGCIPRSAICQFAASCHAVACIMAHRASYDRHVMCQTRAS